MKTNCRYVSSSFNECMLLFLGRGLWFFFIYCNFGTLSPAQNACRRSVVVWCINRFDGVLLMGLRLNLNGAIIFGNSVRKYECGYGSEEIATRDAGGQSDINRMRLLLRTPEI